MSNKKTIEEFIIDARKVHGDKYDYSLVDYINTNEKVKIMCKKHGIFEQIPGSHLNGRNCPYCSNQKVYAGNCLAIHYPEIAKEWHPIKNGKLTAFDITAKSGKKVWWKCKNNKQHFWQTTVANRTRLGSNCPECAGNIKKTTKQFIIEAKKVHGNKYDYSKSNYKNCKTKVKIVCSIHGIFKQAPGSHLQGCGCPYCGNYNIGNKLRKTTKQFIIEAKKVHGNKYDYSLVNYNGDKVKIKIICKKHGIFEQVPGSHLGSNGCPECAGNIKKTTKQFIIEAKKVHGNKYDYSLVNYNGDKVKIKIICKKHGIFEQVAGSHLIHGCSKCGKDILSNLFIKSKEQFIIDAIKVHGDKYDYSLVDYKGADNKIKIICPTHGMFKQVPVSHTCNGSGCPSCNRSKGEDKVSNILKQNNIIYESQKSFETCKNVNRLYFDFYLPEYNLLIEYQGEQHYRAIGFGGLAQKEFQKIQHRDQIKRNWAVENNIKLLEIPYWNFNKIEDILLQEIGELK